MKKKPPVYEFTGIIGQRVGLFYKGVPWVLNTHVPEGVVTIYPAYSREEVSMKMAKKKPSKKKC